MLEKQNSLIKSIEAILGKFLTYEFRGFAFQTLKRSVHVITEKFQPSNLRIRPRSQLYYDCLESAQIGFSGLLVADLPVLFIIRIFYPSDVPVYFVVNISFSSC